jgi:hypothetical protein
MTMGGLSSHGIPEEAQAYFSQPPMNLTGASRRLGCFCASHSPFRYRKAPAEAMLFDAAHARTQAYRQHFVGAFENRGIKFPQVSASIDTLLSTV